MIALAASPVYHAYTYAYPHKTAYRQLSPAPRLDALWADEPKSSLFLYVHVPFCEYRCGFCNLFTRRSPGDDRMDRWLATLKRQASRTRAALGSETRFARVAIGGGTPTYLDADHLAAVLDLAESMGAPLGQVPMSVETSPETATPDRLALLRARGTTRVSIGVQSFVEAEARAVSRPQRTVSVERALGDIREAGFPVLNIDLMYGLPGQTEASFLGSIRSALRFAPEELYLYPLYIRPLTGLGLGRKSWDDARLALYRKGRALLLESGYEQCSLRMFRATRAPGEGGPPYRCQDDGMVGLGCGARSYTRTVHYASEWATSQEGVLDILESWINRTDDRFDLAEWGYTLDGDDQRRRWVIQSLLQREGLSRATYTARFGTDALADLPCLHDLPALGWATLDADTLILTEAGIERSDAIGPWLYSDTAQRLMAESVVG
ncbi:MAG: STM4012 family radical SAM protein [Byssovorax sp.]